MMAVKQLKEDEREARSVRGRRDGAILRLSREKSID